MARSKTRLIVNAIPLINVNTGIGRYIRCLYQALDRLHSGELEICFFDGRSAVKNLPTGPVNLGNWTKQVDLFWKLPPYVALAVRLSHHLLREKRFRSAAEEFDLYHETAFFPFAPRRGLRTVFTIHDLSLIRCPQFHPRERVLFSDLFLRRRCEGVSAFLSVSDFTRREACELLGLDNGMITTAPLAHDRAIFFPRSPEEITEAKSRFRVPDKYFLFVGTGDPRKNMKVVMEALERVSPDIKLVVAGWAGWGRAEADGNQVQFLGYVDDEDLAKLYSGALALLYPSLYEGFGLPVVEAMACGCPVIASREASLPEAAGEAALYLDDPFDSERLGALLLEVASSRELRRALEEKGLAQASRFSWEKTAEKTFQVFERLF